MTSSISTPTTPTATTGHTVHRRPLAEGHLREKNADFIILDIPHTDYQLHLKPQGPISAEVGQMVCGVIRVQARKVFTVPAGGRFIEPNWGRPRHIQGAVIGAISTPGATPGTGDELVVSAGVPLVVKLMPNQKAEDFSRGQLACFEVERGATFRIVEQE